MVVAHATSRALVLSKPREQTSNRTAPLQELQSLEQQVLAALSGAKGRGKEGLTTEQLSSLNGAVEQLEANGGVADPTTNDNLDGRWRLLYTSRPGSASPIQRTFTGVDAFSVFQEVELTADDARINNVVDFGPVIGYLKVEAEASTDTRPIPGFEPRQGAGLPLFGKSFTYPAARANSRIDFQFDKAAFYFKFLPFTLPYPVPFKVLGDERKGWLDLTYMNADATFRLSRGNKGTLFVLVKDVPIKERLLAAIQRADDELVLALISLLQQDNPTPEPARSLLTAGTWRLIWSQQAEDASALQKFGSRQAESFQVIDGEADTLQNIVRLGSWVRIQASAQCAASSDVRTDVNIQGAGIYLGPLKIPVPTGAGTGWVDWLYLDEDIRVTRGSKGSLFVHRREVD